MADTIAHEQLMTRLEALPAWSVVDGKLHRELEFADFPAAFGFMTRVALAAEKADHHPDWSNSWNRVVIDLVTHSAGGITENDLALAQKIDELAG
jgi:4a-hydroxytetrahydrobiopterin dehydratase